MCSDGNLYRPLCLECDIDIQYAILRFMGDPDWKSKADEYAIRERARALENR